MSGIAFALVELHHAGIPALAALETGAEIAEKLLGSHLRNHPLQFTDDSYPTLRIISPYLGFVDDLIDEVLYLLGLGLCGGDPFMQNQAPQESFDKSPALIASAAQDAA